MSEIPGSFKRGRDSVNKRRERLKVSAEELYEDSKLVPKYRNYLQFLNSRELGETAGLQAEKQLCQMKASHKEKILSSNLRMPSSYGNYDSCKVNFIGGDDISCYGNWLMTDNDYKSYYIAAAMHNDINNNVTQIYRHSTRIVDMCQGSSDLYVFARDYPSQHLPPYISVLGVPVDYKKYCPPPWYCCSYIPFSDVALLGCDGYIHLFNPATRYQSKFRVIGKVCTLSYHEPSRVLLAGLSTGMLWIRDLRICSEAYSFKISNATINDSVFLNTQELIVADVESNLVKVDLRTQKTSAIFLGHKHSVTKRPFSVANDMVCATGVDNVIRIWHISGGLPIHVHKSPSNHEVRGWLNTKGNKTYLSCFERDTRTIFTI